MVPPLPLQSVASPNSGHCAPAIGPYKKESINTIAMGKARASSVGSGVPNKRLTMRVPIAAVIRVTATRRPVSCANTVFKEPWNTAEGCVGWVMPER